MLSLDGIRARFERRGAEQCSGERVTQLDHALQASAAPWFDIDADAGAGQAHRTGHAVCCGAARELQRKPQICRRQDWWRLKEKFGLQRAWGTAVVALGVMLLRMA